MPDKIAKKIHSFVKREGRMTQSQQSAINNLFPLYGILTGQGMLDFEKLFGNNHPVILEIGFGMGDSLFDMTLKSPHKNFIGIEVHRPGVGTLLKKIHQMQLKNIRIFNEDAVEVLTQNIPDESLSVIQIFFPDPWPKKRHHKRRLIQRDFVKLLASTLKKDGLLHLATDWEHYAEQMKLVIPEFLSPALQNNLTRPTTKFEQRGKKLGHQIWDLLFVKNPSSEFF